jgi:uroporphyrinogen decarboxylase
MNSYRRVMNTLSGQPVDRLPVFAVLGAYGANLTGVELPTLLSDAAAYVAGQQALQREFGFDLAMSAFDYSVLAEAFGGQIAWFPNQIPNMKRPAARSAAEALSLPIPDILRSARLPVIVEINRRLADLYKGEVPIVSVLPGPCIFPALLIGIEQWMETLLFEPELAQRLLERTAPFFIAWANALLDAGADCLAFTEGMATSAVAPRKLFEEQCLPHLRAVFAQIHGPKIVSSTGGCMNRTLDLLPGLDGLVGAISGSKDDLTESRRLLGPKLAIVGNLDNLSMPTASAERVYEMSMALLREAAPAGPFILANAGADMPQATPPENLRAMLAAGAAFSAEMGLRS